MRLKAFILFGKLAQVVRISKKHFFKQEVKKAWVPLMLHCQDPCSNAAQVRHTWALWAMLSTQGTCASRLLPQLAGVSPTTLSLARTPEAIIC